ncbi:MAG: putative signal peptide protein [Myxococcales bacterium]|nr:putative signal peptide protein [Myxococcales bacterium]
MTTRTAKIVCAALAFAPVAFADDTMKTKPASNAEVVFVKASDIKWSDAPPDLPKGAQVAVLRGDPTKAGAFTLRLKMPAGYKIPPHWHSQDEELTVLSGTLMLHMGDTMKAETHALDPGSYHFLPAKVHHGAEAKGSTVVQLDGPGPFDIHYLNPADNPNPKTATK